MRTYTRIWLILPYVFAVAACNDGAPPTPTPTGPLADHGPGHAESGFAVGVQEVAAGLVSPVHLEEVPDGSGRLFVLEQTGQIRIIQADGTLAPAPFLDISDRIVTNPRGDERGLLGMALHPDYARNGRFFVYYSAPLRESAPADFDHTSNISEFRRVTDDHADPGSERILLQVDQPQRNHNAGMIAFGPADRKL